MPNQTLGVILAGGGSRRMGEDKAQMLLDGKPMIDHMALIMKQIGITEIIVSGDVAGYDCLLDETPQAGPATAIIGVIKQRPGFDRYLIMPVDMPLFPTALGQQLLAAPASAYFADSILPICLHGPGRDGTAITMRDLARLYGATEIASPADQPSEAFLNINTAEEYAIAERAFAN
ncbi:MAG: NTP transferase domain-containing protein [Pseudomonadota bacterium]